MADWNDLTAGDLLARLLHTYQHIRTTCALLPVPIALPAVEINVDVDDLVDGVARVAEISEEIPVPEAVAASLFTTCTYWLTAYDSLLALVMEPKQYRMDSFALCMIGAEGSLGGAIDWLANGES
jgi:hypothetical protein